MFSRSHSSLTTISQRNRFSLDIGTFLIVSFTGIVRTTYIELAVLGDLAGKVLLSMCVPHLPSS